MPPGLALDAGDGTISGKPSFTGIFSVAILGTNVQQGGVPHGGSFNSLVTFAVGPPGNPAAVSFTDVDNKFGRFGGTVTIESPGPGLETLIESYELVWAESPSLAVEGADGIIAVGLTPTGADITFELPAGTVPPPAATRIMALSRNVSTGIRPVVTPLLTSLDFGT